MVGAAEVMTGFESLGDSCEFGFVQRHYGAEPISLLRWAGAPLPGLLRALAAGFRGLYRREELLMVSDDLVVDTKYDLRFHCGDYHPRGGPRPLPLPGGAAADTLYRREAQHVGFLLRNTLENLAERSRIFVYKTSEGLRLEEMLRLKASLDLYGPQRLFCVLPVGGMVAEGAVRVLAPGLAVGGIGRFAPYEIQEQIDAPAWLGLCEQALAIDWQDAVAAPLRAAIPPARAEAALFSLTEDGVALHEWGLARGVVTALYRTLLLRAPDAGGLDDHVAAMMAGRPVEAVVETLLRSAEFGELAAAFRARYGGG